MQTASWYEEFWNAVIQSYYGGTNDRTLHLFQVDQESRLDFKWALNSHLVDKRRITRGNRAVYRKTGEDISI